MVFLSKALKAVNIEKIPLGRLKKFIYNNSYANRYGLYSHDYLDTDLTPENVEALRRLPDDLYDERSYRQLRASQLVINNEYLPKEEWISFEEDCEKGFYLKPYVDQVLAEWKEKVDWEKKYN